MLCSGPWSLVVLPSIIDKGIVVFSRCSVFFYSLSSLHNDLGLGNEFDGVRLKMGYGYGVVWVWWLSVKVGFWTVDGIWRTGSTLQQGSRDEDEGSGVGF